jgi:predicted nucleic acid-binding protein
MRHKPRIFLDTSALFAGIWSAQGGARMLLKLGEAEAVHLLVSSQVLQEIEDVIRRKATQFLPMLAVLLDRSRVSIIPAATQEMLQRCRGLDPYPGDARILADAWHNRVDYLVILDRAHFLDVSNLAGQVPFPIGTSRVCLDWYRENLQENG